MIFKNFEIIWFNVDAFVYFTSLFFLFVDLLPVLIKDKSQLHCS